MEQAEATPIDRNTLVARCLDDPDFVRQLLGLFTSTAPTQMLKLRSALSGEDVREAIRIAHTLKGSAANLSAEGLRQAAAEVERLLRDNQTSAATDLLPLLEGQIKRTIQYVPTLLKSI